MISPRDESPTATNSSPLSEISLQPIILVIFGTRPEAIKLCPLVTALRNHAATRHLRTVVCVTAQHRTLLDQVLKVFQVVPDYDLNVMTEGQTLTQLTARILSSLGEVIAELKPSLSVVQGDTTTTLAGSMASFYAQIPIAHVEAGLRTFDLQSPFPEEMNRVVTSRLAALHFAATPWAAGNLSREGIPADRITVTGNTGIDAVLAIRDRIERGGVVDLPVKLDPSKRLILVTAHRRESFGTGLAEICQALEEIAERPDIEIVWPVHPNPQVHAALSTLLRSKPNVKLIEPLEYVPFVDLMRRAHLLITDSGGVQEEGPSLGKPVLVLRDKTERLEAVAAGTVRLVGTGRDRIVRETMLLLDDQAEYHSMARAHNPYGDGKACGRIAERISTFLGPGF